MAELFGFKFERAKDTGSQEKFTEPSSEDGTLEVAGGGFYGQLLDTDGRERTETYVWKLYRTEWTSDIDAGYYTIVVGTDHDKRGIGTEIEVL